MEIQLHEAKCICNENAYIYRPEVLAELETGCIVRISLSLAEPPHDYWSHDAPYVQIEDVENETFLAKVLDINRDSRYNKYPIATGDKIWFSSKNIIEIPLYPQVEKMTKKLKVYLLPERLIATGPLYTIIYQAEESDSESESYSDSSSENE